MECLYVGEKKFNYHVHQLLNVGLWSPLFHMFALKACPVVSHGIMGPSSQGFVTKTNNFRTILE